MPDNVSSRKPSHRYERSTVTIRGLSFVAYGLISDHDRREGHYDLGPCDSWCALFALAYGILILGYRKKKLSLRRFAILHAVLIVVFPVAASLSLAREPQRMPPGVSGT